MYIYMYIYIHAQYTHVKYTCMYVCMYVRSYVDMRYEPVYNTDLMTWTTIIPCLIFFGVDEDIFHVLNNLKCNLTEIDPCSLVRCS